MKYIKKLNINFNEWDDVISVSLKDEIINYIINNDVTLYDFLINNNILDKYINNIILYYKKNNELNIIMDIVNKVIKKNKYNNSALSGLFDWENAPENMTFWAQMNDKWLNIKK